MAFIQIIDYRASDLDAVKAAGDEYLASVEGKTSARRGILCQHRNDPGRLVQIVFFDSYESAMENSRLPETEAMAEKMTGLADGPPTFSDLDVITDREPVEGKD